MVISVYIIFDHYFNYFPIKAVGVGVSYFERSIGLRCESTLQSSCATIQNTRMSLVNDLVVFVEYSDYEQDYRESV